MQGFASLDVDTFPKQTLSTSKFANPRLLATCLPQAGSEQILSYYYELQGFASLNLYTFPKQTLSTPKLANPRLLGTRNKFFLIIMNGKHLLV